MYIYNKILFKPVTSYEREKNTKINLHMNTSYLERDISFLFDGFNFIKKSTTQIDENGNFLYKIKSTEIYHLRNENGICSTIKHYFLITQIHLFHINDLKRFDSSNNFINSDIIENDVVEIKCNSYNGLFICLGY